MQPKPDHGEEAYRGSGKLEGKKAIITGADSGIGRAVPTAFAREGADMLISYQEEHQDARETVRYVEKAGRKAYDLIVEQHFKQGGDKKSCRMPFLPSNVNLTASYLKF